MQRVALMLGIGGIWKPFLRVYSLHLNPRPGGVEILFNRFQPSDLGGL